MGAVICGQGTFHVRLAVLGAKDEIQYSSVMDIELPQEAIFGSMHVKAWLKGEECFLCCVFFEEMQQI